MIYPSRAVIATVESIFVYIDVASAVKRTQLGGNVLFFSFSKSSKELSIYVGKDFATS